MNTSPLTKQCLGLLLPLLLGCETKYQAEDVDPSYSARIIITGLTALVPVKHDTDSTYQLQALMINDDLHRPTIKWGDDADNGTCGDSCLDIAGKELELYVNGVNYSDPEERMAHIDRTFFDNLVNIQTLTGETVNRFLLPLREQNTFVTSKIHFSQGTLKAGLACDFEWTMIDETGRPRDGFPREISESVVLEISYQEPEKTGVKIRGSPYFLPIPFESSGLQVLLTNDPKIRYWERGLKQKNFLAHFARHLEISRSYKSPEFPETNYLWVADGSSIQSKGCFIGGEPIRCPIAYIPY